MQLTDIKIIIVFAVVIAAIAFFSPRWFSMFLISIFVYLLPRTGFLIFTNWPYPFPIGYIFVGFLMVKWFLSLFIRKERARIENPIREIFTVYVIIAIIAIVVGVINGGNIPTMLFEIAIYFLA